MYRDDSVKYWKLITSQLFRKSYFALACQPGDPYISAGRMSILLTTGFAHVVLAIKTRSYANS
jgi:hypothetical protein